MLEWALKTTVQRSLTDLSPSSRASSTDSYRVPPSLEGGWPASPLLLVALSCCQLLAAAPEAAAQHSMHSRKLRANMRMLFTQHELGRAVM